MAATRNTSPSASTSTTDSIEKALEEEDNLERLLFGNQQANDSNDEDDIEALLNLTLVDQLPCEDDGLNINELPPIGSTSNGGDRIPILYGAPLDWRPPGKPQNWP